MIDFCNCCNGCSSTRQLSYYDRNSFPKKLLVAISLVIIIAMFLTPVEARTLERRRHKRLDNMPQTKETLRTHPEHKRRHHKRLENLTLPTKESRRPKSAELYVRETKKILRKVKNTRSFFREDQQQLKAATELKRYRESVPSWVPSVNFVELHFHDFNSNRAKRNGSSVPERKFKYLMPKLYKSLVEYEELFKRFLNVEFPDGPRQVYKNNRRKLLLNSLDKLYSTIQEVNDSMTAVNMTVPPMKSKLDLSQLPTKIDFSQCLRNDYLAFRGYGNLLNNWYLEFKCPRKGRQANKKICKDFEEKLKGKLDTRRDVKQYSLKNRRRGTT